jgi:Arc/MetJ-type ribon-helix-helix transcriptional regulator
MTILLPPALERLVKEKVGSGLYADESEVVCEALRREFAHDAVQEWVRAEAAAGFEQLSAGELESMRREELLARLAQRGAA